MNAPLLILFDKNGAHTVHTFPNRPAYLAHLAAKEAHALTKGLKLSGYAAPSGTRKADFYVMHPADELPRMPTRKELRAILKHYKEDAQ